MTGLITGTGVGLIAKLSGVKAALARVPAQVWYILGGILAFIGLILLHGHLVHKHDKALIASTIAAEDKRIADRSKKLDQSSAKIANAERAQNAKETTRIVTLTHDVFVRGPGKASCPSLPASSGGYKPADSGSTVDAGVGPVSPSGGQQLIALPFDDLITFAQAYDLRGAELKSWRDNDAAQRKNWNETSANNN